ncbi:hypothetical protein B0A48_17589 [Cryoendolithus antarcticus]|uniref:Uncharacterized protein n=1 Tax=Cryoendolithus antarcticus TaxID=1507870 RepID=A0A1V8SB80_9PEZI|nr:hypothetical protein B0A48_17589 [Cryoendolithus antarcticus]
MSQLASPVTVAHGNAKADRRMSLMEFSLQALLVRHEAYMADAEKERVAMAQHIEDLDGQKQELQRTNDGLVKENRTLLDQLEATNNAVIESDSVLTALQATLLSTQQEMQKLSQLANRAELLEKQLEEFEREQADLQAALDAKEDDRKSSTRRWREAERSLVSMQDQLERIEREAREEKERHVEVVGRMERRRVVEQELTNTSGRLRGAALARTSDTGGTNVVSHFVKDILSDNATLQLGIVELREMLQNSNDEVETLRRQLSDHQPLEDDNDSDRPALGHRNASLQDELSHAASQELHVHHHYHAPSSSAPKQAGTLRRPRKKRYGAIMPGTFTPPVSGRSTPRSSMSYGTPSSVATILQQTAKSVPQPISSAKRTSSQSYQTYQSVYGSSGPSSPQSTVNRSSSLFDRVFSDDGRESSRPTTPDTEDPGSPMFLPQHSERPSGSSMRAFTVPNTLRKPQQSSVGRISLDSILVEDLPPLDRHSHSRNAIIEENENEHEQQTIDTTSPDEYPSAASPFTDESALDLTSTSFYKPRLRRAASHESLLSIAGMDIHTPQSRPSHMLISQPGLTSGAVLSNMHAQATATLGSSYSGAGRSLLSGMAADHRASPNKTVVRKESSWIFGRWGATPAPPTATISSAKATAPAAQARGGSVITALSDKVSTHSAGQDLEATPKKPKPKLRPPGINQSGPIFGFMPEVRVQYAPVIKGLDEEALRRALDE